MQPAFAVSIDKDSLLLRVDLTGLFDATSVAAFSGKAVEAVKTIAIRSRRFSALINLTDFPVQSQSVYALFNHFITSSTAHAHEIAIVRQRALVQVQLQRLFSGRDGIRFFDDAGEAERWLRRDLASASLPSMPVATPRDKAQA